MRYLRAIYGVIQNLFKQLVKDFLKLKIVNGLLRGLFKIGAIKSLHSLYRLYLKTT